MAALTLKTMSSSTPAYLNDLIQTAVPVHPLRSSDAPLQNVPRTRTDFARWSFSVAAPHTWNSLPSDIRPPILWTLGVARILSGVHFSSPKKLTSFLKNTLPKNLSHRPNLLNFLKMDYFLPRGCSLCLGGALTTFLCKFGPEKNFLCPGAARAPNAPPGYAHAVDTFKRHLNTHLLRQS